MILPPARSAAGLLHNLVIEEPEDINLEVIADSVGAIIHHRPLTRCAACLRAVAYSTHADRSFHLMPIKISTWGPSPR